MTTKDLMIRAKEESRSGMPDEQQRNDALRKMADMKGLL